LCRRRHERWINAEFEYLTIYQIFLRSSRLSTGISFDSIAVRLNANAPFFQPVENSFDSLKIISLTKTLAIYTAQLRPVPADTSENTSSLRLVETGIVFKRKDGWKLLSGQTSLLNNKLACLKEIL
jgi:hypothetical protein